MIGFYAVKSVSIPMFLTFRRCGIVATLIIQYFVNGSTPAMNILGATALVCTGAIIGGYENFDTEYFGYLLVWANNFTQSIYNVVMSKLNSDKSITPFEINFFFASFGLPVGAFLSYREG